MVLVVLSFIYLTFSASAQDRCDAAQDIGLGNCLILNNAFGTEDMGTGQFCSDYDNNLWYTFVAQERETSVILIPTFCVFNTGLEMEVFQAAFCTNFDTPLACAATMGVMPLQFDIMTEVGETYYIIVDGIRGDICDYRLHLIHGTCPTNPIACDTLPDPIISGQDSICFGQGVFTYQVDNYDPSLPILWSIPELSEYTDLGNGRIEIDWSNWSGVGNPMICAAQYDDRCRYAKSCFIVQNTSFGFDLMPQSIRRCPSFFPIILENYFNALFVNQLIGVPDGGRVHFFLSREDMLNDVNEVTSLDTIGDYTIFVSLSYGTCTRIPQPADSAFFMTEIVELGVEVDSFCEGEFFNFGSDVRVRELHGYPGWPFDSLAYYAAAEDAALNINRLTLPYSTDQEGKYWARFNTNNGCSDTISFDVNFVESPVFTAISPDTMCSVLGNATYNLLSTPFLFTEGDISDMTFSFYRSEENAINDVNEIGAIVNTSRTFYAVATNSFGCKSEPVPIDVVFLLSPYVEIFGDDDLCVGDSGEVVITTINSPIPFTLILEDDFGNRDSIYGQQQSFFYYFPIFESSSYRIVDFITEPPTYCPYESVDNVDFRIIRLPLAGIEVVTGCGDETGIFFRASQNGLYEIHVRNLTSGATYVFNGEINDEFFPIPLMNGDVLVLDSFQHDSMCWSYEADTTNPVALQPPLEVNNIAIGACNPLASIISFDISGGEQSTYEVTGIPGNITNGNEFTSDPVTSGTYNILVTDGRVCDTVMVQITIDCGCVTDAGSISTLDTLLCENELTSVSIVDTTLAPGDILEFILHDAPPPVFGNVIGSNSNGVFGFDDTNMSLNTTYYITLWAGIGTNGQVDQAAFCSDSSNSIAVRWTTIPVLQMFDTLLLCDNPSDTVVRLTLIGQSPFTISYGIGSMMAGPISTMDNFIDINIVGISQNNDLIITQFENEACEGIVNGDGRITFLQSPEFQNLVYTCSPTKDSFYFEVEIVDGFLPYSLTGIDGQLNGNIFTSVNLPSGFSASLFLEDLYACETIELAINRDCECESNVGVLDPGDIHLCADSQHIFTFLIESIIAIGDEQQFFIKSNNLLDTSGILARQSSNSISFDPSYMSYGVTYYFMPAVGLADMQGDIILDHKCFMPTLPVAFTFYDIPLAQENGGNRLLNCENNLIELDATASIVPVGFNYQWTANPGRFLTGQNTLAPTIDSAGVYQLTISSPFVNCESQIEIVIRENFETALASIIGDTLLNCEFPMLSLNASGSQPINNINTTWTTVDGNFTSPPSGLIVEIDKEGRYTLIVEHTESLCRDTIDFLVSEDFTSPEVEALSSELLLNCDRNELLLVLDSTRLILADDVSWNSQNSFNIISDYIIEVNSVGTYHVDVANEISKCRTSLEFEITGDFQEPVLVLPGEYVIDCINLEASMTVDVTQGSGSYRYQWFSSNGIITGNPTSATVGTLGEGDFEVTVTDLSNGCQSVGATVVNSLQDFIDDIELVFSDAPCDFIDRGEIFVQNIVGGTEPFRILINDDVYQRVPVNVIPAAAGEYSIHVSDVNGCTFDTVFSINNAQQVSLALEDIIEIDEGQSLQIIPTIMGIVDTFGYFIEDSLLHSLNEIDPTIYPDSDFLLKLIIYSPDSCMAMDVMQVFVRRYYNMYIPSAFSPNEDGRNDVFHVFGPDKLQSISRMQIYNRWGERVFELRDGLPNDIRFGWNGELNGMPAAEGVYSYVIIGVFDDGTEKQVQGDFTLVR